MANETTSTSTTRNIIRTMITKDLVVLSVMEFSEISNKLKGGGKGILHTLQMIPSVQKTLLPQQVSITTTGYIYFLSQSTTQKSQEGCSKPGEDMNIKKKKKGKIP